MLAIITSLALVNVAAQTTAERKFQHDYQEPTRQYEDPLSSAWGGAWRGALIGLGTGLSVGLIQSASGAEPNVGRLTSGLTGAGFIAGATYGFIRATMINSDVDERQQRLEERYGAWSPFFYNDGRRTFAGLSMSLAVGGG